MTAFRMQFGKLFAFVAVGFILGSGAFFSHEADALLKATSNSGGPMAAPILAPSGAAATPAYSFSAAPTTGIYYTPNQINFAINGTQAAMVNATGILADQLTLSRTNQTVVLVRDADDTLAQKRSTNAQANRLYFSTTGPVYWQATARTAGVLYTATGGAAQVSYAQTTVPTCSSNCGTSPSVVGTDTAGIVTMGATGSPASGWVVTFNGTWPSAPACIVVASKTGMVAGKAPIVVATSTTTMTVTTNGTAPANGDTYAYQCNGVS